MSEFLLVLIAGLLVYLVYDREKEKKPQKNKNVIDNSLMDMIGKYCEISLKEWLVYIDGDYTLTGIIKEMDDDWLVIEVTKKNKIKTKVIRKSLISHIKIVNQK